MNRRPLKKTSEIEYMVEDGESKTSPGKAPIEEGKRTDDGKETRSEGREGTGRHSIRDTREEMERGREGKTEVRAIGQ